jgi:deoxyribose-phosphate aldolase
VDLAPHIEHTRLAAETTPHGVEEVCRDAAEAGLFGVCVNPIHVALAKKRLEGTNVRLVTVAGFPMGAARTEVDMVMAIGLALASDWTAVEEDVRAVREAIPRSVLKVILETGHFDDAGIKRAAEVCVVAGADFVKTSTGYGPRGATVHDVELLVAAVSGRARVKASGGIRTHTQGVALVQAGASRLGTSRGVAIARSLTSAR